MDTIKFISCRKIRLNQGGYDRTGYYWGTGQPLYQADIEVNDEFHWRHYRADNRAAAIAQLQSEFPKLIKKRERVVNGVTIRTNGHHLELIDATWLNETEQAEFDYLDWSAIKDGTDTATFFRYRGDLYDLGQFMRVIPHGSKSSHPTDCDNDAFGGWDGYQSDSFFSGLLVKYVDDGEALVVARYYS